VESIKSLSLDQLSDRLSALGEPRYRAKQVMQWIYGRRVAAFSDMSDLSASLRETLAGAFAARPLELVRQTGSGDETRKFLFRLHDGQMIETVLIPASPGLSGSVASRQTLCISSQVGCAYGCKFCASGLDGWKRNLDAGEMVDQVIYAEAISGKRVNNLVFMGMGEPLANFENLVSAISTLNAPWGVGIGARHMTVSTSGLVPMIRRLAEQPLQVRLAVSLHGATDAVREQIMPVNRRYPLSELLDACEYFRSLKKQKITFEYILIAGVNDAPEHALDLARVATRIAAKVNVIPCNAVDGLTWERPSERAQRLFLSTLTRAGANATIRREKGHDIAAACGQLRLKQQLEESGVAAV